MKKNILPEQINELSEIYIQQITYLWIPQIGDLYISQENELNVVGKGYVKDLSHKPLFNIGQMIEFIGIGSIPYDIWESSDEYDFCDNLWDEVKEKLKEQIKQE